MPSEVETFYDRRAAGEWERLERNPTEFAVTLQALADHLGIVCSYRSTVSNHGVYNSFFRNLTLVIRQGLEPP